MSCPGCGSTLPSPGTEARPVPRVCPRCHEPYTVRGRRLIPLGWCEVCTHPFPVHEGRRRCPACRTGRGPVERSAEAVEQVAADLRDEIRRRARSAEVPGTAEYVAGIITRLARGPNPPAVEVVLLDEAGAGSQVLPDGTLLISLGLLAGLRDEAELAFVVAHELAHVRQDAPWRRGAPRGAGHGPLSWSHGLPGRRSRARRRLRQTLETVLPLGYGREAELAADAAAVASLADAGYDAEAAFRFLSRGEGTGAEGTFFAHLMAPLARRRERVMASLASLPRSDRPGIVNKEVYRRAVGGFDVFARRAPAV